MELIVGSDESELAVPGREFDVPGRASCWANGMGRAAEPLSSEPLARSSTVTSGGGSLGGPRRRPIQSVHTTLLPTEHMVPTHALIFCTSVRWILCIL